MVKEEAEGLSITVKPRRAPDTRERLLPELIIDDEVHHNVFFKVMAGLLLIALVLLVLGIGFESVVAISFSMVIAVASMGVALLMGKRTTYFLPPDLNREECSILMRVTRRYWVFGKDRVLKVPLYCVYRAALKEVENPKMPGQTTQSIVLELFEGEEDAVYGERDPDENDFNVISLSMFGDKHALEMKKKIVQIINEFLERFRNWLVEHPDNPAAGPSSNFILTGTATQTDAAINGSTQELDEPEPEPDSKEADTLL